MPIKLEFLQKLSLTLSITGIYMSEENTTLDEFAIRKQKLQDITDAGIDAFGHRFTDFSHSEDVKATFVEDAEEHIPAKVAGRILAVRKMGAKSIFMTLSDEQGTIQLFANKAHMTEDDFARFAKLDIGDIIGAEGRLFKTKTGEITVREFKYTILSKALRPLPEKYNGLKDVETRYRQRYLDLISNRDSSKTLRQRSLIVKEVRRYLEDQNYLEVETPMMHPIPGGATARPFVTHYNALDQKMYMRIAPELYLKKLLVGGFEKVFELNRNFRNEGLSKRHNPEFTCLEVYEAFGDRRTMQELVEGLIQHCAQKVIGTLQIPNEAGEIIDFSKFTEIDYKDLVRERTVENWFELDNAERIKIAREMGAHVDDKAEELEITHEVYDKCIEQTLIQPTFVCRLPKEFVPLAKRCKKDSSLVDVYELIIDGKEISPGYTELNDPIDQRQRLEDQLERSKGTEEEESGAIDEDFLTALEHGMPPAGGLGLGVDRLIMLLTGAANIRDVILFPQLKNRS